MYSTYQWYQSPVPSELKPGALSWMALDGHARYYVPGRLLAQSFVNRSRDTAAFRYIFSLTGKDMKAAQNFADQIILFVSDMAGEDEGRGLVLQKFDKPSAWSSNEFDKGGNWTARHQDEGEFGLTDEAVALWTDVFKACLDWEQTGWHGMIR
ncbi:hypothetical protein Sste5346_008866 [Sporothrix stenoceras]|uniref:Uncharacterized protein n=1 Tax=Sporothrix stenoceras TaxID=5173 RepID=A0ABR3YMS3_9PEZI